MNKNMVRNEMLKAHKNCSVGLMCSKTTAFMVWNVGHEMHSESIALKECTISSRDFKAACNRAKEALIH